MKSLWSAGVAAGSGERPGGEAAACSSGSAGTGPATTGAPRARLWVSVVLPQLTSSISSRFSVNYLEAV